MSRRKSNKPVIETMINTTALLFTSYGGTLLYQKSYLIACILVLFGFSLEFAKYWGRKERLW